MSSPRNDWQTLPAIEQGRLVADLISLGLSNGAVVLVHSSLSRLGNVVGGAETVVDALQEAVGSSGTVLFPTLTGSPKDGPSQPPVFDVRSTPCWTGRIPETARQRSGARRSLHPTHSVTALGSSAAFYISGHEQTATPCDRHSPYYRLIANGGQILLLGATQDSNTTLHCLEELADVPYHLQDDLTDGVVVDARGIRQIVRNRLHLWRWERDFPKIEVPLQAAGVLRNGRVGLAEARLIRASDLAEVILPLLRADPLYFLSQDARAAFERADKTR